MTDTVFVNGTTLTDSDWFNDVNRLHYTIFGDPATGAAGFGTVINALTADATPDQDADFLVTYDASAGTGKKVLAKNIKRMAPITNSLSGNVALNNASNFFDGPTVAQGSTGIWFASGSVVITETSGGAANFMLKLWDGTSVIASASYQNLSGALVDRPVSLSGFISSPAGDIRISVKASTTTAQITANTTGTGMDCTVTAIRIG